jgi:serine/threonine-protein kinase RsbW
VGKVESASIEIINDLEELVRLEEFLSAFPGKCWFEDQTYFHLSLVCDELITNTILYGYEAGEQRIHIIRVTVTCTDDWVELQIMDDGIAFDPFSRPQPDLTLDIEERPIGGLGIHFVKQVMDEIRYERVGSYNLISMKKKRQEPKAEGLG